MKKLILLVLSICLIVFSLTGCGEKENEKKEIEIELSLDKTLVELEVGSNTTITANLEGVIWTSENEVIAIVDNGVVTANQKGETKVVATKGEKTAECVVVVSEKEISFTDYPSIQISTKAEKVLKGFSFNVETVVRNGESVIDDCVIDFLSDNTDVVSINGEGLAVAKSAGKATLTAKTNYDGSVLEDSVDVVVEDEFVLIAYENISEGKQIIDEGRSFTVNATVSSLTYDVDHFEKTGKDSSLIEWVSEDENIATVSNGVITAQKPGTCNILSKYNGETLNSISVNVVRSVFTFENDKEGVSVARNIEGVSIVDWSSLQYNPTNLQGEKLLKISGFKSVIGEIVLDFGTPIKAGTKISFDLITDYVGDFIDQDGWFWLMLNGKDLFDGTFTDFTYVVWGKYEMTVNYTLEQDCDGKIKLGFNLGRSVNASGDGYKNFVFYVDNFGIETQYSVKTLKQKSIGVDDYEESSVTASSLRNFIIDYSELAIENAPSGYIFNSAKSFVTGVNDGSLVLELYYDLLPAITTMNAEGDLDINYLSKDGNSGTFDISIVDYTTEGITVPKNGGSKVIKVTNSSTGYPVFNIKLGQTVSAGSTLIFDFACKDPNGASGHFGLIVDGVWYDLNNQGCYHWDLSGAWAHYSVALKADTDTISLGAHVGSGTFASVSNVSEVNFYFDNIGIATEYTVKTYMPKETGGYKVTSTETKVDLEGASIDYTSEATANKPAGYVLNTTKSILTGENDGTLLIKVYYDLIPSKTTFDFESNDDLTYVSTTIGTPEIIDVSDVVEGTTACVSTGAPSGKVLKVTDSNNSITISFGKTISAGTTISLDFALTVPGKMNNCSGNNFAGISVAGASAQYWHCDATWNALSITTTSATDKITFTFDLTNLTYVAGELKATDVLIYFDNIVVVEK